MEDDKNGILPKWKTTKIAKCVVSIKNKIFLFVSKTFNTVRNIMLLENDRFCTDVFTPLPRQPSGTSTVRVKLWVQYKTSKNNLTFST